MCPHIQQDLLFVMSMVGPANLGVKAEYWSCSSTGFLLPTGLSLWALGALVGDIVQFYTWPCLDTLGWEGSH